MGLLADLLHRVVGNNQLSDNMFPPTATYDVERDMPEQRGKIVIVTGANTGVGFETALALVLKHAKVYVCSRSEEKGVAAVDKINKVRDEKDACGHAVWLQLDLADLDSVKKAAAEFKSKETQLDLLFCNAGVMVPPLDQLTKQGFDLQWGTNVVGHYLFSILLLPSLRASYAANGVPPRVVQTSSAGHALAPGTGFEESIIYGGVKRVEQMKKWGSTRAKWAAYGMSKAGNIFVANILQDELKEEGVSMSVHPGVLKSELWRSSPSWQMLFMNWALHPSSQGALTQLWGATSPEGAKFGRKYLLPWARLGVADKRTENVETAKLVKEHLDKEISPWL